MWPVGVVMSRVCRGPGRGSGGPAGEFFGVVAGFAESGAVVPGGGAVVVPGDDVVEVADGCVAVGGAAGVVPGLDDAAEPGREEPGAGVHGGEVAGAGGGVEPAQPDGQVPVAGRVPAVVPAGRCGHPFRLFIRSGACIHSRRARCRAVSGVGEQFPGPAGGDDAVAGEAGGFAVALEEGAVGHDELDLDAADPAGGAGGAFDQGVGHELPAGPGVPGAAEGVGVPGEAGVHRDALRDGEQGGEVAHGVRGRAEADVPFGGGVAGPLGDGARIPAVGGGPGGGDDAPVPGAVERPGVGGEFGVDGGPVLRGQARRFLHQQGRPPFVELPGLQRREGVGHLGDEGFRQAQEPAALGGGFAPGQGDLRADPGPELRRGHPGVGLFAALEQVEGDGQTRLTGRQGRLLVFQGPDFSNQTRTVRSGTSPNGRTAASDRATSVTVTPAGGIAPAG